MIQGALEVLHAARYELLTTEFNTSLAQGLAAIRRLSEGITLINQTIQRVETNGDVLYQRPRLLTHFGIPKSGEI